MGFLSDILNRSLTTLKIQHHMLKGQSAWKPPSDNCTQLTGPPPVLSAVVAHGCFHSPNRRQNRTHDAAKKGLSYRAQWCTNPPSTGLDDFGRASMLQRHDLYLPCGLTKTQTISTLLSGGPQIMPTYTLAFVGVSCPLHWNGRAMGLSFH